MGSPNPPQRAGGSPDTGPDLGAAGPRGQSPGSYGTARPGTHGATRWSIAGMAAAGALTAIWLFVAALDLAQRGQLAVALVLLGYVALAVSPAVLGVLSDHPRRALVAWLAAVSLCGVFPCALAAWVIVAVPRFRRRGTPPAGAAGARGQLASASGADGPAGYVTADQVLGDLESQVMPLIQDADVRLALAYENRGAAVPWWIEPVADDLSSALLLLRRMTGRGPGWRDQSRNP